MRLRLFLSAFAITGALLPAADVTPLDARPGLWESTVTTSVPGRAGASGMPAIPPEALAKMPPEQRARVEAMMKSRAAGGGMTTKVCITRETLASGAFGRRDNSCTTKLVSSSARKQVVHVECGREGMKSSGDMTVEAVSPEHIRGSMVMKANVEGQAAGGMTMSFDNKWISADCGNVKPPAVK